MIIYILCLYLCCLCQIDDIGNKVSREDDDEAESDKLKIQVNDRKKGRWSRYIRNKLSGGISVIRGLSLRSSQRRSDDMENLIISAGARAIHEQLSREVVTKKHVKGHQRTTTESQSRVSFADQIAGDDTTKSTGRSPYNKVPVEEDNINHDENDVDHDIEMTFTRMDRKEDSLEDSKRQSHQQIVSNTVDSDHYRRHSQDGQREANVTNDHADSVITALQEVNTGSASRYNCFAFVKRFFTKNDLQGFFCPFFMAVRWRFINFTMSGMAAVCAMLYVSGEQFVE